jgi:hypothetical protein
MRIMARLCPVLFLAHRSFKVRNYDTLKLFIFKNTNIHLCSIGLSSDQSARQSITMFSKGLDIYSFRPLWRTPSINPLPRTSDRANIQCHNHKPWDRMIIPDQYSSKPWLWGHYTSDLLRPSREPKCISTAGTFPILEPRVQWLYNCG